MKALYWLPYRKHSIAELARVGYRGLSSAASCLELPVDPVLWSYSVVIEDDEFHLESRFNSAPPVLGLPHCPPMSPDELWAWIRQGIHRYELGYSVDASDINPLEPRQLLALGSQLLRHHAQAERQIDNEGCGFSFVLLGVGMIWLYRLTECELCYRLVGPSQTRCALHSRSKIRQEHGKHATRLELRRARRLSGGRVSSLLWRPGDDRLFSGRLEVAAGTKSQFPKSKKSWRSKHSALLDDINPWFGSVPAGAREPYTGFQSHKQGPFNAFIRAVLPDLLLPEREREDPEIRVAWDTQIKSCARVRRQLPVTFCWMSFDEQVAEVRKRLDSEAPTIRVLIKSLEIAERWLEAAEAIDKGHTRQVWTEQDFRRIALRHSQGEYLVHIAAVLEVCPNNLRHRMAQWQQSLADSLKS